jgi:hypothetical protein
MEEEICGGRVRKHCGYSKNTHNSCQLLKRRAQGTEVFLIHEDTLKWYFCQICASLFSITCTDQLTRSVRCLFSYPAGIASDSLSVLVGYGEAISRSQD